MKYLLLFILLFPYSILLSQSKGYFPLDSGNIWIFNNNPFLKVESMGEEVINGAIYKKLYDRMLYPVGSSLTLYLRIEQNKVFQYDPNGKKENLLYDFSVPGGTTIYIDSTGYYIKCTENKLIMFNGKELRQWKYEYGRSCIDCQREMVILDSIGWYMETQAFVTYRLTGGIIKGKPIVTAINNTQMTDDATYIEIYPTPFNSSSLIKFKSLYDSNIKIVIYNVIGQEVKTIYEGIVKKGISTFAFDGNNLASGMYLCRFQLSEKSVTKKIQILK